jgi:hypothetical protein
VRYLFDADDLAWLNFQLSERGERQKAAKEAARENRQACRSDVWRRIARCYSYSTIVGCSNCKYEFTCQTSRGRGKCDPSNKYINYEFDYYCDPEIGKEFDTREEVLQDSCR